MGFYLGFHPEVSAEEQEIRRKLFSTGGIPDKWPSGDRVWFFPKKFQNFPNVLQKTVIDRLTPSAYAALVTTRMTKRGKEVPDMKPWGWAGTFKPFVFTDLGEYITGQRKWGAKTKAQAHQKARADASAPLEKPRYVKHPDKTRTFEPSEALKSRLEKIMENIVAGEEDFGKRQIGLWIDKLQTPHGDDYQEATSTTEYHGWDSSVKY
jgi:hypothetical protein